MDYFEKKQWIRIAVCAVLVAAIALAMTGVFSGGEQLIYDEKAAALAGTESAEATEKGFGGEVTVHVAFDAEKTVKELTVDTPDETEGLGKRASEEEFTAQFIDKAAPFVYGENGIEALSGATVTSNAVLAALNRAVSGGETAPAEAPAEEKSEETEPEATEAPTEEKTEEAGTEETKAEEEKTEKAKTEETKAEETKTEGKQPETAAADGQVYGSFRSVKENDFSKVFVTIGAKNGRITTCRIQSEGEQDLLTDALRDEWAKAIVESGSAAPDAITGATLKFSAQSVQDAVTEILAQMNGEAPAETTEAPAEGQASEAKPEEPKAEEAKTEGKQSETAAADGQVYGSFRSVKENDFSRVIVTIGAKNGRITTCRIQSEGEQDLLTDALRDEWAKAIVESGSAAPDAITGSTLKFSAQSVQDAAAEILAQMNGEAPAEEKAEEIPEEAGNPVPLYAGYRADRENDFSKVTVIATTKSGKLASVKILSSGEQDLLTDGIRSAWAQAILESGSAAPDAITGATLKFSAQSVREAMEEILEKTAVPVK